MAVAVTRSADEALCLNEVSHDELRAIATEEQDLLCVQPADHAIYRIRKVCGRRALPRSNGMVVEAKIVDARCAADVPTGALRFHFCRSFPCKSVFTGLTAPVPHAHVVCLRATPQDQQVNLSSYAPSTQSALAATPVADQIKGYAEYVRSPYRFVGIYTFLAFAVQQRREVRVWFTKTHYVDIVESYAPWSRSNEGGSGASTEPPPGVGKRFNVLACVIESGEENVRSIRMLRGIEEVGLVNHYLPLIERGTYMSQTPAHPPCNGMLCSKAGDACMAQVRADVSTLGMFPVRSVTDGDCAFDTMLFLENAPRSTSARRAKRVLLSQYALDRKDDPNWRASWIACGESAPEAPATTAAPATAPAPGSATKPAPGSEPALAAPLDSPAPAPGSEPALAATPGAPCSSSVVSEIAPVAQTPNVHVASVSASSSSSGTCPSATTVAAVPANPEVLAAAIMAFVGQKRISPPEIRRLAACLSKEETDRLLKDYAEQMAAQAEKTTQQVVRTRIRHDRYVDQRSHDAALVAAFAARRGVDPCAKKVPGGFWRSFFLETFGEARLKKESTRSLIALKMYWKRRLLTNGAQDSVPCTKGKRLGGEKNARRRKRRLGKQGRPVMAIGIEEGLLSWFVAIRRRGVRVGPRSFRKKALALRKVHIQAAIKKGIRAEVPSCSLKYCLAVRRRLRISLRAPVIKWKVSRPIMNERMEICWLNLAKIIKMCLLFHGYEPILDSRDQTGKHMNECGSKNRKTL